ncbi:MAG: hypothetical protein K1X35_14755 [Caulobacteraceae bacterium]|nr:hypothetical protein [Caulobacteraceae bacterium]
MSKPDETAPKLPSAKARREAELAAALRNNLRRRKAAKSGAPGGADQTD